MKLFKRKRKQATGAVSGGRQEAQQKEPSGAVSEEKLLQIFAEYFVPNRKFFSTPGSAKWNNYFGVVNEAREEMLRNPRLFEAATRWTLREFVDLVNNSKPLITNSLVCGLIFTVGKYAVTKDDALCCVDLCEDVSNCVAKDDALYCVDFCENVPNCIALYLLLTAQKQPVDKRVTSIDAGDESDPTALINAMDALSVCDPHWRYRIF